MDYILVTDTFTPFVQILLALCLGMLLGIERTFAGKTAGIRTYGLVAMGSCIFTVISSVIAPQYSGVFNFDPTRLAAAVVTGIGFLGAGLIIFKDSKISGLTTATGLWVASAIGIAVGYGFFGIAVFSTILTLVVFSVVWSIERRLLENMEKNNSGENSGQGLK